MTGPTNGCSELEFLENTMKKILLASVAFLGMAAIVPAQAADLAALKAIGNPKRLAILGWLKNPRAHFPPQRDGDLVKDGVVQF